MSTSPPWRTDAWNLAADLNKIEQQWVAVRRILEDDELFRASDPSVSAWSCGQQAGHAVLVARTIASQIEGNLLEPSRNQDQTTPELALRLLTAGTFKRGAAEAPPDARPEPHTRDHFLEVLPGAISAWRQLRDRAHELPACAARYRHFALGYLTSSEWVRMCAVHTAHHLKVVRDIAGEETLADRAPGTDGPQR